MRSELSVEIAPVPKPEIYSATLNPTHPVAPGANRRLVDARNALQRMQQANAMIPDAVGSMLALADPAAADAAAALMNLSGTGHCSDTILAGAGLTVY